MRTFKEMALDEAFWGASVAMLAKKQLDDKAKLSTSKTDEVAPLYIPDELNPKSFKNKTKHTNLIPNENGHYFMWGKTMEDIKKDLKSVFKLSKKEIDNLIKR